MATQVDLTIDCADPDRLVPFWAAALGYVVEPPPAGAASWVDYWRSIGVPEDELPEPGVEVNDSIIDPAGLRPRIWFQLVPEAKVVKNRLHLDLRVSGGREVAIDVRRQRVRDEASRLVAFGATKLRENGGEGADYFAVVLQDPEGNEFCVA